MANRKPKQTEIATNVAAAVAPVNAQESVTLADNTIGALRADGAAQQEYDASVQSFAALFAKVAYYDAKLPGNFPVYVAMRREWLAGYDAGERGITDAAGIDKLAASGKPSDAAERAFDRRWKAAQGLKSAPLGDKPSSAVPSSVARQEKRTAAKAEAEAKQAALAKVNVEALVKKMTDANAAGKVDDAIKLADEIKAAREAQHKVAKAAADAQWKKSVAAFDDRVKAIRASHDAKLVAAAYAALAKFVPAKAAS